MAFYFFRFCLRGGDDEGFMPPQSECVLSSAVEHFLHTEGVAGSNPAARTILLLPAYRLLRSHAIFEFGFPSL